MSLKLPPPTPANIRLMLRLLAVVVLLSGLGSALSIWRAEDRLGQQAGASAADVNGPLAPEDSRRYTRDVEQYYGQTGLLVDKWERWLGEMTHGKPLARTIAVASLVVAGGLFYVTAKRGKARLG